MSRDLLVQFEQFVASGSGQWIPFVVLPLLMYWFASFVTGHMRAYAIAEGVLDIPNARSSHTVPTPRGGGVALLLAIIPAIAAALVLQVLSSSTAAALLFGGGGVALMGWLDDHGSLSARRRLFWQMIVAVLAVLLVGGLPVLHFGPWTVRLGAWGIPLAVIGVVWCTNLYNFIDGIDGLAGSQAVLIGLGAGGLLLVVGESGLALVALCTGFAALGFLRWNWPPARIFMGDVGSGLLGFVFGVLAIAAEPDGRVGIFVWSLLAGVLIVDATATIIRRWGRGEHVFQPHRKHAFVRLVISGWSHKRVAVAYLLYALVPLACAGVMVLVPEEALWCWGAGTIWLIIGYLLIERRIPMFGPRTD